MPNAIRLLVIASHHLVERAELSTRLDCGYSVQAAVAHTGSDALEACEAFRPEIVLLDTVMADMDSQEAAQAIRDRYPGIQVMALANGDPGGQGMPGATAAGAPNGAGKVNVPLQCAATRCDGRPRDNGTACAAPRAALLTARELEVLALLVKGLSNQQIGVELFVSRATAKFHVSSILGKLGAATRTEAAVLAVQQRLTPMTLG